MRTVQLKPTTAALLPKAKFIPIDWQAGELQKTIVLQHVLTEAQIQALAKLLLLARKPIERAFLLNAYLDTLERELAGMGIDPEWLAFVLLNSPDIDKARERMERS